MHEFNLEVVLGKQKAAELLLHFPLHWSRVFKKKKEKTQEKSNLQRVLFSAV